MVFRYKFLFLTVGLCLLVLTVGGFWKYSSRSNVATNDVEVKNSQGKIEEEENSDCLVSPISKYQSRITKKPFGIHVAPGNSPVFPERFSGFHTGTDFETFSQEKNEAVPVEAICSGKIVLKRYVSGYGGVLVEECAFEGKVVTVVYGHLSLDSIEKKLGDELKSSDQFAILGDPQKGETDGERKHLHLGIRIGAEINLRGYVADQKSLADWLNVQDYFCQ